nr:TIGR04222 domain-containing membrane protein [Planctomycetota bacterium]
MRDLALRQRVEAFDIDSGTPSLTFEKRLARENGWSVGYAERVVREYKRFAILAASAGHPVTPSEEVDQAWHLHLTYTESYWRRFCGEALEYELHHHPTAGGSDEQTKFFDWYERTLESYRRLFDEEPPADIWPSSERRFATVGQARWVDTSRHWVISRRRVTSMLMWAVLLIGLPLLGGCAGGEAPGPFGMGGSAFLVFYFGVVLIGITSAYFIRWKAQPDLGETSESTTDPYEIACLSGGPRAAVTAALASMLAQDLVEVSRERKTGFAALFGSNWKLKKAESLPDNATHLEKTIYSAIRNTDRAVKDVFEIGATQAEPAREKLVQRGLVFDPTNMPATRHRIPGLIMLSIVVLGGLRMIQGVMNDQEIGFLALLTVTAAVVGSGVAFRPSYRTRAGDAVLKKLKAKHDGL